MKKSIEPNIEFYHHLGKLFYAVAAADKVVHDKEFERLQSCVSDFWLDVDDVEDTFGTDAAYLIEVVFEGLIFFKSTSEEMYEAFVDYYQSQNHFFTPRIKILIMRTAREIANSFAGTNKSELIILGKLELEMKD